MHMLFYLGALGWLEGTVGVLCLPPTELKGVDEQLAIWSPYAFLSSPLSPPSPLTLYLPLLSL